MARPLHRISPLLLLCVLAACQREPANPPTPQPALPPPAPTPAATTPPAPALPVESAEPAAPTPEAATPPPRAPDKKEAERIQADATGHAAILACDLVPRARITARERSRRNGMLSKGVDPALYDAAYAKTFDRVTTRYPLAKPEVQVQVCDHARVFAKRALGEGAIKATDKL